MILKSIIALSITIVRLLLCVKIISWIILEIINPNKQSIMDIELYLVGLLLDFWLFSNVSEIVIKEKED